MKKFLTVTLLMATLSICVHADDGIIQGGLNSTVPPPPPPPASAPQNINDATETVNGIIQTGLTVTATVLRNLLAL
jgi:hypothetical protein